MTFIYLLAPFLLLLIPKFRHDILHILIHVWEHHLSERSAFLVLVVIVAGMYAAPFIITASVMYFTFGISLGYSFLGGLSAFVIFVVRLFFSYRANMEAMGEYALKRYASSNNRDRTSDT